LSLIVLTSAFRFVSSVIYCVCHVGCQTAEEVGIKMYHLTSYLLPHYLVKFYCKLSLSLKWHRVI